MSNHATGKVSFKTWVLTHKDKDKDAKLFELVNNNDIFEDFHNGQDGEEFFKQYSLNADYSQENADYYAKALHDYTHSHDNKEHNNRSNN